MIDRTQGIDENRGKLKKIMINCGDGGIHTPCHPLKEPCLFNIQNDPCEKNNIAQEYPQIVKELLTLMKQYNATAVIPNNTPDDPKCDPALHEYRWDSWVK